MKINKFVAIGDSFTEGVGDFVPGFPNGVRGWADMVAAALAKHNPNFQYANLAVRGYLLEQIIAQQVPQVLEMQPDLVSFCAGGNNLIRPKVEVDKLVSKIETVLDKFLANQIKVLVWTAADAPKQPIFRHLRGRFALFNELLREMLATKKSGIILIDYWRMREYSNPNLWDEDRLHLSTLGHEVMAKAVLTALGQPPDENINIPPAPVLSSTAVRKENLRWYKEFLFPWVKRRIEGTSSGDDIKPKYPVLAPVTFLNQG